MDLNKENMKKIRGLILYTVIVLVAGWNYKSVFTAIRFLGHVLLPFALGGAIAFVLNVPMCCVEEKLFGKAKQKEQSWAAKLARPVSFVLTVLFVVGIIALVVFVVVPELGNTVLNLGKTIQEFIPQVQLWAETIFRDNPDMIKQIQSIEFEWDKILGNVVDFFKNGAGTVIGSTYQAAKSVVNGMTTFFIAFVFSCYILLQKEKLSVQVKKVMYAFMPEDWRNILLALASVTYKTFSSFLTGQCLEAVILGSMFLVVMAIIRLPYALLIAILIAFTALIPIFGAFIGCAIGTFLIFMVSPVKALIFIVMFLVLQQIEGNFIYPHVVGNSVGLPSIWVLVAVSVGGSLMGIVGMLIFIPIVSVVYTIFRGIVNRRLKEKKIVVE